MGLQDDDLYKTEQCDQAADCRGCPTDQQRYCIARDRLPPALERRAAAVLAKIGINAALICERHTGCSCSCYHHGPHIKQDSCRPAGKCPACVPFNRSTCALAGGMMCSNDCQACYIYHRPAKPPAGPAAAWLCSKTAHQDAKIRRDNE